MTCIVAIKDTIYNNIYMGGDRAASNEDTVVTLANPKVWSRNGYLIGFAGSMSGDRLYYNFEPPSIPDHTDLDTFMHTKFISTLRDFYEKWWIDTSSQDADLCLLIAVRGKIYEHHASDMSLVSIDSDYVALGSGSSFAYGALHASNSDWSTESRVRVALEAAIKYSPLCGGPIDIISNK